MKYYFIVINFLLYSFKSLCMCISKSIVFFLCLLLFKDMAAGAFQHAEEGNNANPFPHPQRPISWPRAFLGFLRPANPASANYYYSCITVSIGFIILLYTFILQVLSYIRPDHYAGILESLQNATTTTPMNNTLSLHDQRLWHFSWLKALLSLPLFRGGDLKLLIDTHNISSPYVDQ